MTSKPGRFQLPADAQPGDCVLVTCPACDQLVYVLVIPSSDQYLAEIMNLMAGALATHQLLTGHDQQARRDGRTRAERASER